MKVLLRRNVPSLGKIGDVVEVKPGYARNYLLPRRLAVQPTRGNLKAVEAEKEAYLKELSRLKAEIEAKAALLEGKEITISAMANQQGHLYGSVGPAQIVAALAEQNIFIDPQNILLGEPIRQLDKYDLKVRFAEDVTAMIHVWIVPSRESLQAAEESAKEEAAKEKAAQETEKADQSGSTEE